ncbi:MAG: SDR family NAD(P)-dependent oxidoreductase [Propionibacteriaceae bacterium]|nr:SDR family NAD(P)-dependent oxidoreductase [Propionibacteriaceae bacterium]
MDNNAHRPVAIVMGASRGLGLLMAGELARRGHDVAICARDQESLERAATQLRAHGGRVLPLVCDVTDPDAVEAFVADVTEELGPIDVAIHVAGIIQVGPVEAVTRKHFSDAIDIMLWGAINMALAVLPGMRERRRGRIGVVTSIGGKLSAPRLLPYATAKFGAVGFTEGLSAELAGSGVTATTLVPGLMRTGSHGRAQFFGDAGKQYAWFGPAASLPLLSMDAERAAAKMVDGVLKGKPVKLVSALSHVATRVHGLAPNLTIRLNQALSLLLPKGTSSETKEGVDARKELKPGGIVSKLTTLGDAAAARFNEGRQDH